MDKLTKALRDDAAAIRADVSTALDERIRASLERVAEERQATRTVRNRPVSLWWASSLTGVAAVIAAVLFLNVQQPQQAPTPGVASSGQNNVTPLAMPVLRTEKAMLTAPLVDELQKLEADLKKAERAVREDIGL